MLLIARSKGSCFHAPARSDGAAVVFCLIAKESGEPLRVEMTKTIKFDEIDRKRVIREVQEHLKVNLSPVGRRAKWLCDDDGRSFWILGGSGEWHGIPDEMMDAEVNKPTDGTLVIAMRKREEIQIFAGPLAPIVRNRSKLFRARTTSHQYQFTISSHGNRVFIKQIPGSALRALTNITYRNHDKEEDQKFETADRVIRRQLPQLSPQTRKRIIEELARYE